MSHELPLRCHVVLPGMPAGSNIALCVLGERGVRLTAINLGEAAEAQTIVRALNSGLDISEQAERAMLAGCLLGWTMHRPTNLTPYGPAWRHAAPNTKLLH